MKNSSNSDTKIWWIEKNGKKIGPMTEAELRRRVVDGDITWQHRARCAGTVAWKPIASLNILSGVSYDAASVSQPASRPGERNDDSLLFSPTEIVSGEIDRTPTESSGVLDLRRLRAAYAAHEAKQAEKAEKAPLPVFAGEAFHVSSSMLLPLARKPRKRSPLVYGLAAAACVLTMTSAALATVVIGKNAGERLGSGAATHALLATVDAAPSITSPTTPPALSVTQPDAVAPVLPEPVEPVATTPPVAVITPDKTPTRKRVTPKVTKTVRKTPATKTPKEPAKKWDEYACLLAVDPPPACSVYSGTTAPAKQPVAAAPDPTLPASVSRTQISSAMRKLDNRIDRCADLLPGAGLVKVSVKVAPSGKVTSVRATSSPDAALSSCITAAVDKASFPETQTGASFAWAFPLR